MARQMSVWFETFSASVPRAIGTPAAASSFHLPVWVVPLASFSADVGFCEMRAPEAMTARHVPLVQARHVVEQDPVVQRADAVHVRDRALAEHPSSSSTSAWLVDLCRTNRLSYSRARSAAPRLRASEQVPTPSIVTASRIRGRPNLRTVSMPSRQPVERRVGVHAQPVGQPVGAGRARLVPASRDRSGPGCPRRRAPRARRRGGCSPAPRTASCRTGSSRRPRGARRRACRPR